MSELMPYPAGQSRETAFSRWWHSRNFLQKRLIRFCLSMLAMVICFPLYYAGLFGGVDGPLNPARIGSQLAAMGVTRTHAMLLFLSFLIMAVSWNWIFNMVGMAIGSRLTCKRVLGEPGRFCGAPVTRRMAQHKKTGAKIPQYICAEGHKRPDAHFHPVKKGAVSHCIWAVSLAFCVIVWFMS